MNSATKKEAVVNRESHPAVPEWWAALSDGERAVIHAVVRMLRGAKRSQLRDVAQAAAKWERGIGCFIKVRLIHSYQSGAAPRRLPKRGPLADHAATSSQSGGRNQPGASPNRD